MLANFPEFLPETSTFSLGYYSKGSGNSELYLVMEKDVENMYKTYCDPQQEANLWSDGRPSTQNSATAEDTPGTGCKGNGVRKKVMKASPCVSQYVKRLTGLWNSYRISMEISIPLYGFACGQTCFNLGHTETMKTLQIACCSVEVGRKGQKRNPS